MNDAAYNNGRIINVSNRLPIKINSTEGNITYQNSEGGLATGLSCVLTEYDNIWIGWPGADVQADLQQTVIEELALQKLHPVFLDQKEINNFYEGFSNETIWPLFHYFPTYSNYNPEYWESYVSVNRKFADEILKFASAGDIIWIHDYHLMLLPQLLRAAIPNITIGYFQHIPFPSYEIFRALPWKKQILNGLIGADIIGFQTEDDTKYFTNSVNRILKLNVQNHEFLCEGRKVCVEAFPISIDYKKYNALSAHEATKKIAQKLEKLINTKIIISIDRLDYSKGIIQRLQAFDLFLKQYPEWRQKVTFIHLVVPSRDTARNYRALKREMDRLISDINGKYATLSWQPIRHFYRSFPPNLLSALYKSADLALVTPLIDGMNLVCKEYVASNVHKHGALVLSESAGAARELKEAILINPNDVEIFADSINEGLMMPQEERSDRMLKMQQKVQQNDIFSWAQKMLKSLNTIKDKRAQNNCIPITSSIYHTLDIRYTYSQKRLIFLDYDGTLVPFNKRPEDAYPDTEILQTLEHLASDTHNNVVIISGRDKGTLERWLGHLPLNIVAEHGASYKEKGSIWHNIAGLDMSWKPMVNEILESYTSLPGTFIEEKTHSLAWHYRLADAKQGDEFAGKLIKDLKMRLDGEMLDVMHGNKVVETKSSLVNKGKAALRFITRNQYDFILAIGDDMTDEDMFKVMPLTAITVKVGSRISAASYYVKSYMDVRTFLNEIHTTEHTINTKIQLAS